MFDACLCTPGSNVQESAYLDSLDIIPGVEWVCVLLLFVDDSPVHDVFRNPRGSTIPRFLRAASFLYPRTSPIWGNPEPARLHFAKFYVHIDLLDIK